MRHQSAEVRVPAARRVGLTFTVAEYIQAGRALQGQRFSDHRQLVRPLDQLKLLRLPFLRFRPASLCRVVIACRVILRISSGRLTLR